MKLIYYDDERLVLEIVSGAWWHHAIRAGIYMTTVSAISCFLVTKILAYKCYPWVNNLINCQLSRDGWFLIISALSPVILVIVHIVYSMNPYRERLIFSKTQGKIIYIRNFLFGSRRQVTSTDSTCLQWEYDEGDSESAPQYSIVLVNKGLAELRYVLRKGYEKEEGQKFWNSDPALQILKQFVHSEVK